MAEGTLRIPSNPRHRDPKKGLGLEIDTWTFVPVEREREGEAREIKIFFVKSGGGGSLDMEFVARHPELPGGEIGSSDIEDLREEVTKAMAHLFSVVKGLVWEDWLEVRTSGRADLPGSWRHVAGQNLELSYKTIRRGRNPADPSVDLTLNMNGFTMPFPRSKQAGREDSVEEDGTPLIPNVLGGVRISSGRANDAEIAFVRDTPQNRIALDQMVSSVALLRERIAHFLGAEQIAQSMLEIQTGRLAIGLKSRVQPTPSTEGAAAAAEQALSDVQFKRRGPRP